MSNNNITRGGKRPNSGRKKLPPDQKKYIVNFGIYLSGAELNRLGGYERIKQEFSDFIFNRLNN
jgi:hypothetical protein